MRAAILLAAALVGAASCASCTRTEPEFGVDLFSADTVPARVEMTLTGTLALGMRAEQFLSTPDTGLLLVTPASLVVQQGAGTATIYSVDSSQALVMQPLGLSPDSSEKVAITGRVLRLTRVGEERNVRMEVVKP